MHTEKINLVKSTKNNSLAFLSVGTSVSSIDCGISRGVRDSSKFSMSKALHEGRMEATFTAEKESGLKRNSTDLWTKNGFLSSQVCDFSLEKANVPEMTVFYLNQGYLSYKDLLPRCFYCRSSRAIAEHA